MMADNHSNLIRLGVNLDHIATVRNARGENYPSPIRGAHIASKAGADNITLHLREDRRHIHDTDLIRYQAEISLPLNMEMAATSEMQKIALNVSPHAITLVPENRAEKTTEGGLDLLNHYNHLRDFIGVLKSRSHALISFFIEPDLTQIDAAKALGADAIEIHTGRYARLSGQEQIDELSRIQISANHAVKIGLNCHAGHGLTYDNVGAIAKITAISELNIGHFIISEAIFVSLEIAIKNMRTLITQARAS